MGRVRRWSDWQAWRPLLIRELDAAELVLLQWFWASDLHRLVRPRRASGTFPKSALANIVARACVTRHADRSG
jgi:hypothetical protein